MTTLQSQGKAELAVANALWVDVSSTIAPDFVRLCQDRVEDLSREYFSEALRIGTYRGWLAEELNGHIMGGGGIVVAD